MILYEYYSHGQLIAINACQIMLNISVYIMAFMFQWKTPSLYLFIHLFTLVLKQLFIETCEYIMRTPYIDVIVLFNRILFLTNPQESYF